MREPNKLPKKGEDVTESPTARVLCFTMSAGVLGTYLFPGGGSFTNPLVWRGEAPDLPATAQLVFFKDTPTYSTARYPSANSTVDCCPVGARASQLTDSVDNAH